MPANIFFKMGLDVGSTTAKAVVIDNNNNIIYTAYKRHNADIRGTLIGLLKEVDEKVESSSILVSITGSAGLGISEISGIPFVQEVVASAEASRKFFKDVYTLVDMGGEDSKMIFFNEKHQADIRMNGSCAGGTGAFIDQMAELLDIDVSEMNSLAEKHENIYPVASRCGVFAKTDVQNLLSRDISKADVAASIFHAVAIQVLNTLSRGFDVKKKILFCGGPLAFIPALREAFIKRMNITDEDVVIPDRPELIPSLGASINESSKLFVLSELVETLTSGKGELKVLDKREMALFKDESEKQKWLSERYFKVKTIDFTSIRDKKCFIGVDSGSTTTKAVLLDSDGGILRHFYEPNKGNHIKAVKKALTYFNDEIKKSGVNVEIAGTAVTGYGEDLVKALFSFDYGIVETVAHLKAAKTMEKNVDFVLDIGGQDMKAMFIQNGNIQRIELNEACSSGCGSFIHTFAASLGYDTETFANMAVDAEKPCDLGSRCTVFMNSKVKQALREGASVAEISAGLAYSVIKNCLYKVLKIRDFSKIGKKIVLQGGTFKNPAVHRAFEKLTGKKAIVPDLSGVMGAWGTALYALEQYKLTEYNTVFKGFEILETVENITRKNFNCNGCENVCTVSRLTSADGKIFFTGNKCEKVFSNDGGASNYKGFDFAAFKKELIFNRRLKSENATMTIGIPRALNMYEDYPFWVTLLVNSDINVELSDPTTMKLYEKGAGTVMSDNICFPAKVVHGHIINLAEKGVDRIFYPEVLFEKDDKLGINSFNCPIVTGYPEVIKSSVNSAEKYNIPLDSPSVSFKDMKLLKKTCLKYLKSLGVSSSKAEKAFALAVNAQKEFKEKLREKGAEIIKKAKAENRTVVILTGRPYHLDSLINQKIPEMLSAFGIDFISGDAVPRPESVKDSGILSQWAYPNRLVAAAKFAAAEDLEVMQLNSFGCGPDAVATDEMRHILESKGKNLTVIRIDEIASPGSAKLRIRTMIESFKMAGTALEKKEDNKTLPAFLEKDNKRLILVPFFGRFYSRFVETVFRSAGMNIKVLPEPDSKSLELGLKYANNEICYPAILVIGDIIRALQSGEYNTNEIAIGITQTGGQCRASNYLGMIKKAMLSAGYDDVPVVSITAAEKLNTQPGLKYNKLEVIRKGLNTILYIDALSSMYYAAVPRAENREEVESLMEEYLEKWNNIVSNSGKKEMLRLIEKAVESFNNIKYKKSLKDIAQIGIVGEIYIKYSDFGNHNVIEWLMENNVEVVIPQLTDFFLQEFVNFDVNQKELLKDGNFITNLLSVFVEKSLGRLVSKINEKITSFRYARKFHPIRNMADKASKVISLVHQYGEGWLIAGEILSFVEDKINHVLCLQPFGCIANQIIAKGIEKKLKDIAPDLNMLFIDLDSDTSVANFQNRLHFLIQGAIESRKNGFETGVNLIG